MATTFSTFSKQSKSKVKMEYKKKTILVFLPRSAYLKNLASLSLQDIEMVLEAILYILYISQFYSKLEITGEFYLRLTRLKHGI